MNVVTTNQNSPKRSLPKRSKMVSRQPISVQDVASYCMVNPGTVRRWIRDGKLKSIKLPSSQNRISVADFRDFLTRYGIPVVEDFFQRF
jgi:excisionase family DNA binding protein